MRGTFISITQKFFFFFEIYITQKVEILELNDITQIVMFLEYDRTLSQIIDDPFRAFIFSKVGD